jgi:hypothetical protein
MTPCSALIVIALCAISSDSSQRKPADEPLLNWAAWEKYRTAVVHPAATVKPAGLARARENIARHKWAAQYARGVESSAKGWLAKLTPEYLRLMIPTTTPGDTLFTPCPACRDQGKPWHPHGQWRWSATEPDRLTCQICGTIYPNAEYAEDIVLRSKYAPGQQFTYCRAAPMQIFSYLGRPSFAANCRARKALYLAGQCRRLAEAYALSDKPEYAQATRLLLLRFAEVYPTWLVHVGYGEYADMDPHVAALNIKNLPEDELCPPPVHPDRRLHTGYWSAGRASGVGMEAGFVRQMVESYEFVCQATEAGRPIFSDAERRRIERDLLLESSVLLVADPDVNNKSVGNATAVSLVGMSTGHPGLVRFGLDVFLKTVDGWFLPDGGTPESWSYATMTLGGIAPLGRALAGYSDPPGYRDPQGKRIERMDLYHQTAYGRVWEAMFNGLQEDLAYPPLADGSRRGQLGAHFTELMADNYPERPQYVALLKELTGTQFERSDRQLALYERPAGLGQKPTPPLKLVDYCYPVLQMGYLRGGADGRDSTLILSASDWGGHHHDDSLNLYYSVHGEELLSDLGYLWDHTERIKTVRTFAHNTVMVDGKEQITKGRGGRFTMFDARSPVKVMEAESQAYPQATLYRRTVAQVELPDGRPYVLDMFRVAGGRCHEYVFHGPNRDLSSEGIAAQTAPAGWAHFSGRFTLPGPMELENVRSCDRPGMVRLTWKIGRDQRFQAVWPNQPGETTMLGDGWGQRDWHNTDVGALLPYIVRRCPATALPTVYLTAFAPQAGDASTVVDVRRLPVPAAEAAGVVLAAVDTPAGVDYFASCLMAHPVKLNTPEGTLELDGRFAMVRTKAGKPIFSRLVEGQSLRWNGKPVAK